MIASRHGADRRLQPRHDLDIERDAGLLPAHRHDPVSDMLPAHSYHVAAGLPGLQEKARRPAARAFRARGALQTGRIRRFPRVMADCLRLDEFQADKRVGPDHLQREAMIKKAAHRLLEIALRRRALSVDNILKRDFRIAAMLLVPRSSRNRGTAAVPSPKREPILKGAGPINRYEDSASAFLRSLLLIVIRPSVFIFHLPSARSRSTPLSRRLLHVVVRSAQSFRFLPGSCGLSSSGSSLDRFPPSAEISQTATSSGEGKCQQAGTEQDEAACGECEETGGREIIVAHDMPPGSKVVRIY